MPKNDYTISKLLPIVLLSSACSVIIVYSFRFIIMKPIYLQSAMLSHPIIAPLIGTAILILLFHLFAKHLKSGLPHVVLRFHIGSGTLPFLNLLFQYLSASIALLTGFAIGAIGPAVHIGATSANLVGQLFKVPEQTLRVLTACGAATAITIMLDTPLMAILFTYETIVRQLRWRTLLLVIASALSAQAFADQVGIQALIINVFPFSISWLLMLKMGLFGIVCGLLSSAFLNCIDFITQKVKVNYWKKLLLAGLITSIFLWYAPLTAGLGYQLLQSLLYQPQAITLITTYLAIRFIGSVCVIALAVPGGALGPSLILGALTGSLFSMVFDLGDNQLFVIVGMGAFLGAVLHVPLAGILFVLESTNDLQLFLPCILAGYCAYYIHQHFSKENNLIELLLARQNVALHNSQSLKDKKLTSSL